MSVYPSSFSIGTRALSNCAARSRFTASKGLITASRISISSGRFIALSVIGLASGVLLYRFGKPLYILLRHRCKMLPQQLVDEDVAVAIFAKEAAPVVIPG